MTSDPNVDWEDWQPVVVDDETVANIETEIDWLRRARGWLNIALMVMSGFAIAGFWWEPGFGIGAIVGIGSAIWGMLADMRRHRRTR